MIFLIILIIINLILFIGEIIDLYVLYKRLNKNKKEFIKYLIRKDMEEWLQ